MSVLLTDKVEPTPLPSMAKPPDPNKEPVMLTVLPIWTNPLIERQLPNAIAGAIDAKADELIERLLTGAYRDPRNAGPLTVIVEPKIESEFVESELNVARQTDRLFASATVEHAVRPEVMIEPDVLRENPMFRSIERNPDWIQVPGTLKLVPYRVLDETEVTPSAEWPEDESLLRTIAPESADTDCPRAVEQTDKKDLNAVKLLIDSVEPKIAEPTTDGTLTDPARPQPVTLCPAAARSATAEKEPKMPGEAQDKRPIEPVLATDIPLPTASSLKPPASTVADPDALADSNRARRREDKLLLI